MVTAQTQQCDTVMLIHTPILVINRLIKKMSYDFSLHGIYLRLGLKVSVGGWGLG